VHSFAAKHRARAWNWLRTSSDAAGLAVFRIALGLILSFSAIRFITKGWVNEILVAPRFHFTYYGFDWVRPWPEPWMTLHVALMAVAGALITVGLFTRTAAGAYLILFSYAELIEKAAYLNHYYLVSLLVALLIFLPSNQLWSLDKRWKLTPARPVLNAHYALLRAQIGIVYLYAGLAKLNPDWLFRAEPVHTWLRAYAEMPLIGPWVGEPAAAFVMCYLGAFYDLTVPFALANPRTRPFWTAFGVVFHLAISFLFPVGIFSYVMLTGLTTYFHPSWPHRVLARLGVHSAIPPEIGRVTSSGSPRIHPAWIGVAALHLALQLLLPLRFLLYPGHVNWTEQGFRFSWRVMLIEKAGLAEFRVTHRESGRNFLVLPKDELTPLQRRQMATQADMIQEYALHLAERFRARPDDPVEVRVDSFVAWNGRPSQRFIDPRVDLAAQPRGLGAARWILPNPPTWF
jgi:vitamin K-dependent gamma-carboxylase